MDTSVHAVYWVVSHVQDNPLIAADIKHRGRESGGDAWKQYVRWSACTSTLFVGFTAAGDNSGLSQLLGRSAAGSGGQFFGMKHRRRAQRGSHDIHT